jgi:hypothetical protein
MAQANTISPQQLAELKALVRRAGYELKPLRTEPVTKWTRRRIARSYKGISAAECKGPTLIHKGKLCPGHHLWPQDIAAYYASVGA